MIEAWFSSSLMTVFPSVAIVGITPSFAVQHETYESEASNPNTAAIFASSSRWMSNVPQMKRTDAVPAPYFFSPSIPAATTSG